MTDASVIGRGTHVRGNVRGDGSLEIHGRIDGDVAMGGDVVIGPDAVVRGSVTASQLSVSGAVQGDLRGNETLLVERGARVLGDLSSPRLGVAPGALVKGNVRTDGEAPLAQPARRAGGIGQPLRSATSAPLSQAKPAPFKAEPARTPAAAYTAAAPPPSAASVSVSAQTPATAPKSVERESVPPPSSESAMSAPKREREAPPPVVPALGKHAKAKKKRREG